MRYLRVIAQDRNGNGKADTVKLHFYQKQSSSPDELHHEAVATDVSEDGIIDIFQTGDINFDGRTNLSDQLLLQKFASTFFKLNWFNKRISLSRALTLYVEQYNKNGTPKTIKLDFTEHTDNKRIESLIYSITAHDKDGNGVLESFSKADVDFNGIANSADKKLVKALSNMYLKFNWHQL